MLSIIKLACYQLTDIFDINEMIYNIYQTIIIQMNIQPIIDEYIRCIVSAYHISTTDFIVSQIDRQSIDDTSTSYVKNLMCYPCHATHNQNIMSICIQPYYIAENEIYYLHERYLYICSACIFS
jgi:hypothetical protein